MADISKITLPSGNTYDIKDAVARQAIAGGIVFSVAWDGVSTPTIANIPQGVVVTYSATDYTGTMAASAGTMGTFYLVKTGTGTNKYDEYVTIRTGTSENYTYAWEKLGTQEVDLSGLGSLAYKNSVTLSKGDGVGVLGSSATFTTTVTPTTTNIKATASGGAVTASGTDTFVKSYPGATSKLATSTIKGVSSTADKTLVFSMGTGNDSETLIISGTGFASNSNTYTASAVTATSDTTFATGSLAANGGGDSVMTGLGTATTGSAVTGVSMSTQPTVALSTGATAGTGVISVATGITSATTTTNSKDEKTVPVLSDLSVSVS